MVEIIIALFCITIFGILWKTGIGTYVADVFGVQAERAEKWLKDEEGYWANLPERLPYREFDPETETVETENGVLWMGFEMSPIPTDGYSREDWWRAGVALNNMCVSLPDHTRIQIVRKIGNSIAEGVATFDRITNNAPNDVLKIIARSRRFHLEKEKRDGNIKTHNLYIIFGVQAQRFDQKVPLGGMLRTSDWIDLEREAFNSLYEDLKLSVGQFVNGLNALGSRTRLLGAEDIKNMAFAKLNPNHPIKTAPKSSVQQSSENNSDNNFDLFIDDLENSGLLDSDKQAEIDTGAPVYYHEEDFPVSPREELVQTPLKIKSNIFNFEGVPIMVISLKKLPTRTYAGLSEKLTRSAEIDFPCEINSHMEIANTEKKIREYENDFGKAAQYLSFFFSASEIEKKNQLESICKVLSNGEEKVGDLGFSISFSAPTINELKRRERLILTILRAMENLEGYAEWAHPLDQFLSTLPCAIERDRRRRAGLTRDFIGISPLTGSPLGVSPDEAIDVVQTASGGLFYLNPGSTRFNSGTSIFIGAKRSGKSAALNRQRTVFRMETRRGVTIDYGGSASRVCAALGGTYVDITKARGLGLFSIKPEPGEHFSEDELNENGIPLPKLAEVQKRLEIMCLEATEPELPKRLLSYLRRGVERTYARLEGRTPRIDDFITTFERALDDDREIGKELAARLEIYREGGSLGHLLNDSEDNKIPTDLPYIVFDFAGAIGDPRLMLVGTMAVDHYTKRLLRTDRSIKKWIDIDEFSVIADDYRLCKIAEIILRTDSKSNCICSIASQDAADFFPTTSLTEDPRRAIRASAEIFWIFTTPKPDVTAEVLGLSKGIERLLKKLDRAGGETHRDCAYVYPGGAVHLRLRNGALDKRLLLGAGRERATLDEALSEATIVGGGVPQQLARALAMDGLSGALRSKKTSKSKSENELEEILN